MTSQSQRQANSRARKKEQGLKRLELWAQEGNHEEIKQFAAALDVSDILWFEAKDQSDE